MKNHVYEGVIHLYAKSLTRTALKLCIFAFLAIPISMASAQTVPASYVTDASGYNYIQPSDANGGMNFFTYWGVGVPSRGYFNFYSASATSPALSIRSNGNVGIGTTSPGALLSVAGSAGSNAALVAATNSNSAGAGAISAVNNSGYSLNLQMSGSAYTSSAYYNQAYLVVNGSSVAGLTIETNGSQSSSGTTPIYLQAGGYAVTPQITVLPSGNVGVGTTTPGSDLPTNMQSSKAFEVNGNIALVNGSGASIVFQDGTVQSTAYTGTCPSTGGDYAESVDVEGDKKSYEPGDVMVLASDGAFDVVKSSEAYSTLVAGIYSTKPGYVGRRQITDPKLSSKEIPMAMVGIVPTKVSAENGPIHRGDLLVTASLAGYAMKGTDHNRMMGAVVGKAMGSLSSGRGVIEVLVSLQ